MIPKKIHFIYIYGSEEKLMFREFCLVNYLCIKSAKEINPDYEIHLYCTLEPQNNGWWNKARELVDFIHILESEYQIIGGKEIVYVEHIADLRRLLILKESGGIYLDVDVICLKPFDSLLNYSTVMAPEVYERKINGLCNAVILCEPNSQFINRWIEKFDLEFEPYDWNKMSVRIPHEMANEYTKDIHLEPYDSFFAYNWQTIEYLHCNLKPMDNSHVSELDNAFCLHLWQSRWYHSALRHITVEDIEIRNSRLNTIFRRFL
jgi:mannosyltransferase OCH1-like enzyme